MRYQIKVEGVEDMLAALDPKTHARIVANTVNQVGRDTRHFIINNILERYNLSKRKLSKRIYFRSVGQKYFYKGSKRQYTSASIFIRSKKFNVAEFNKTKETAEGIIFQVRKGQRESFDGGFIAIPKGKEYARRGQVRPITGTRPLAFSQGKRVKGKAYKIYGIMPKREGGGTILPSEALSTADMFDKEATDKFVNQRFIPTLGRKIIDLLNKPKRKRRK